MVVLVALGSNRRHGRHGAPCGVVSAAIEALAATGLAIKSVSRIRTTAPLGPGGRQFANAAIAIETSLPLPTLLRLIKRIESDFGRRGGRRWGDRVLDLDIIGAGDMAVASGSLQVPHPRLAGRRFVLDPLVEIAPCWRHPLLNLTARQLRARAMRPKGARSRLR